MKNRWEIDGGGEKTRAVLLKKYLITIKKRDYLAIFSKWQKKPRENSKLAKTAKI